MLKKEIYFATRCHDQHVSSRVFEKLGKGVTVHILDGNPEQIRRIVMMMH
jgi:hypothetical protein